MKRIFCARVAVPLLALQAFICGIAASAIIISPIAIAQDGSTQDQTNNIPDPGDGGGNNDNFTFNVEHLERQGVDQRLQPHDVGLLGDQIDPNSGSVTFSHVDVSLPGNSDLPVVIARRREQGRKYYGGVSVDFADWQLDTPRISVITAVRLGTDGLPEGSPTWPATRCSAQAGPGEINAGDTPDPESVIEDYEYSNGISLEIPGQGSKPVFEVGAGRGWPAGTKKVTTDFWALKCISNINGGGEGFEAFAPNGDKYTFNRLIYRRAESQAGSNLARYHAIILATNITDVHGTSVDYVYDSNERLMRIESSDNRLITLTYNGNSQLIDTVSANGRVWDYNYISAGGSSYLDRVTLPEGRYWDLGLTSLDQTPAEGDCTTVDVSTSLKHPDGMVGTFTFAETKHGRTFVPTIGMSGGRNCTTGESGMLPMMFPPRPYFEAMSLASKTLQGNGYPAATWTYTYSGDEGSFTDDGGLPDTKWTQEIDPLGRKKMSYFNRVWGTAEGLLEKEDLFETESDTLPVQSTFMTYNFEEPVGTSYMVFENNNKNTMPRPGIRVSVVRDADTHIREYTYNHNINSTSYSYTSPTLIERFAVPAGTTRTQATDYTHNKTKWLLSLPTKITRNNKVFEEFCYDSAASNCIGSTQPPSKGLVTRYRQFDTSGSDVTLTYHSDGNVHTHTDALSRVTTLTNYHRGLPETIQRPDGISETQDVDNNGWVISSTNGRGFTTSYAYNDVGWLTLINRPNPASDSIYTYPAGSLGNGLQRVHVRDNLEVKEFYDGLLRPTLIRQKDLSGVAPRINTQMAYDSLGREVRASLPYHDGQPIQWIDTTYDALDRITQVKEQFAPFATTGMSYLPGAQTRIIDPSNVITTNSYNRFGSPDGGDLIKTAQRPNAVDRITTNLTYNEFSNLTRVRQLGSSNGITVDKRQNFKYDNRLRLCRQSVPETGDTWYSYDNANQLVRSVPGQTFSNGIGPCVGPATSNQSQDKIGYFYDDLGRLIYTNYPAGTQDISREYDANSNVTAVIRGGVRWDYLYNSADFLRAELLKIPGRTTDRVDHSVNGSGHLLERRYPDLQWVGFEPDGFGRPTEIQGLDGPDNPNPNQLWASGMSYHANGTLASATYRNGQVLTQGLSARQLLQSIHVAKNGAAEVDLFYHYDARGLITAIDDRKIPAWSRSNITYDGIGRLTGADGPWGSANYQYDALGNMRSKTVGTQTVTMAYDDVVTNRLSCLSVNGGGCATWGHDNFGNVTNTDRHTFTYDRSNQPTSMSGAGSNGSFIYDGNLRRVRQIQNNKTIYSFYSQSGALLYRDDITNGDDFKYLPAGVRVKNMEAEYIHKDHLGSPVAATDEAGIIKWRQLHQPYGMRTVNAANNQDNEGFTGHIDDTASGLTYMQARYYDPLSGRFLSNDPVGFADTGNPQMFNRYSYALNDPVNNIDPDGRMSNPLSGFRANGDRDPIAQGCSGCGARVAGAVADFTPVVGDIKGFADAIANPSAINIAAAVVGVVPVVGDVAGKAIKGAANTRKGATVGRRGESHTAAGNNQATEIGGREFSGHALDRMQEAGMTPSVVEDTIANGTATAGTGARAGTTKFETGQAMAVTDDATGRVITTDPLEGRN